LSYSGRRDCDKRLDFFTAQCGYRMRRWLIGTVSYHRTLNMTSRTTSSLLITSPSMKRLNASTQTMKSGETRDTQIGSSLSAERSEVATSELSFNLNPEILSE
jgi:hypothetical protein